MEKRKLQHVAFGLQEQSLVGDQLEQFLTEYKHWQFCQRNCTSLDLQRLYALYACSFICWIFPLCAYSTL